MAAAICRPAAALLVASALTACAPGPAELVRCEGAQASMGTEFRVVAYARDRASGAQAIEAALARVAQLDALLSDYDEESELSRLSARSFESAPTGPVRVSSELWSLLAAAEEWSRATDGAFDVTVGPFVRLWRRSARQEELPSAEQLTEAAAAVGYGNLRLLPGAVELLAADMRLDLGGIAKGFALDECLRVLREQGVDSALVDGGGDIAASGPPPGERGWVVALAPPTEGGSEAPLVLQLVDAAVATSGDTERFVELDGQRYSHLVDPRTGLGLTRRVGATAIAPDGMTADVLASAACVLEPAKALALLERTQRAEGRVVDGETGAALATSGFDAWLLAAE